jgi:hypothetical protein
MVLKTNSGVTSANNHCQGEWYEGHSSWHCAAQQQQQPMVVSRIHRPAAPEWRILPASTSE